MTAQQREVLDATLRARPFDATTPLVQRRAEFEAAFGAAPLPDGARSEVTTLGGRHTRKLTPEPVDPGAALLYLHGGGYIVGSAETGQHLAGALARRAGVTAFVPDYRLAPEHPYPAAVDDAVAAYRELLDSGQRPDRLVLAGDSAGGGLSLALLVAARDNGLPLPAAVVLFSPYTDLAASGDTVRTHAGLDPLLTPAALDLFADAYLAGADATAPLASPLYADLAGLPPLLIQSGGHEILLADATRVAQRAALAGVDLTFDVTPGVPHVFQAFEGSLDEADDALDRAGAFLRVALQQTTAVTG